MMDAYAVPLEKSFCDTIDPHLYAELQGLGVKDVLDVAAFVRAKKYQPCVSTIFLIGDGGSHNYTEGDRHIYIHNGTLASVRRGEQSVAFGIQSDEYQRLMRASESPSVSKA